MKILFIQLPLIDHGYNYIGGNVPYASAALTAYINNNTEGHSAEYLPYNLANFFSDKNIIKYVLNCDCDAVSFCSYLWNIERNFLIAEKLKKLRPSLKIIFGGPEICSDSFALNIQRPQVDVFFSGEGEWFFRRYFNGEYLEHVSEVGGNRLVEQPAGQDVSVDELCEPYSCGFLNDMPDGSVFIELTRGCPFRCSYCYYSKNSQKIREINFDTIIDTIKYKKSVKEIYILSPTFNGNRHFQERLDQLIKLKHDVRLHTELKAEGIDYNTAKKIYAAGFKSLEIGIQTLNKTALKKAGRRADTDSEIAGLQNLMKAGIDLKVGIIPGLPEDSPEDFVNTIDTLVDNGLGETLEFYPLMILPGTRIREQVGEYKIKYQSKPPYFIISSRDFSSERIIYLKNYLEDTTGLYSTVSKNPDLIQSEHARFCKGLRFKMNDAEKFSDDFLEDTVDTNVFTLVTEFQVSPDYSVLEKLFSLLGNRTELFNLVIEGNSFLDDELVYGFLKKIEKDDLFRRIHLYDDWKAGNSVMVYHYTDDYSLFKKLNSLYYYTEPVLKLTSENISLFKKEFRKFEDVPAVFVSKEIFDSNDSFLVKNYAEYYDRISFESKDSYRAFIEKGRGEYIDFPFEFRIMDFSL